MGARIAAVAGLFVAAVAAAVMLGNWWMFPTAVAMAGASAWLGVRHGERAHS